VRLQSNALELEVREASPRPRGCPTHPHNPLWGVTTIVSEAPRGTLHWARRYVYRNRSLPWQSQPPQAAAALRYCRQSALPRRRPLAPIPWSAGPHDAPGLYHLSGSPVARRVAVRPLELAWFDPAHAEYQVWPAAPLSPLMSRAAPSTDGRPAAGSNPPPQGGFPGAPALREQGP